MSSCHAPSHGDGAAFKAGCRCPDTILLMSERIRAGRLGIDVDDPPDELAVEMALYGQIAANQLRADERRLAVTELIAAGYSTREIAHRMRYPFAEARRDRHVLNARRRRAQQARTDREEKP